MNRQGVGAFSDEKGYQASQMYERQHKRAHSQNASKLIDKGMNWRPKALPHIKENQHHKEMEANENTRDHRRKKHSMGYGVFLLSCVIVFFHI